MEHSANGVTPVRRRHGRLRQFKESLVYKLPDDLPLDAGAFLEPLSIAVHAVDIAKVKTGDSVIITGGGPIGLLILAGCHQSRRRQKCWFPNRSQKKRALAKRSGADVTVDPLNEDLLAIANKFTDGPRF